jgi:hypothetical protein
MAEEEGEGGQAPRRTGGGGGSVFTRKLMGVPVWLLMAAGLGVVLAVSSYSSNKKKAAAGGTGTGPATATTAAGSALASQTPPFIIQNYPNQPTVPAAAPSMTTDKGNIQSPQVVAAGHNEPVQEVINWAQKNGYPNYSWSDFWALNPTIPGLAMPDGKNWQLTGWGTPITLAKPGFISAGTGSISEDYKPK